MFFAAFHLLGALVTRQPAAIAGVLDEGEQREERGAWRDWGLAFMATHGGSDRAAFVGRQPSADGGRELDGVDATRRRAPPQGGYRLAAAMPVRRNKTGDAPATRLSAASGSCHLPSASYHRRSAVAQRGS